jgi:outer membrane protein insertion porin family
MESNCVFFKEDFVGNVCTSFVLMVVVALFSQPAFGETPGTPTAQDATAAPETTAEKNESTEEEQQNRLDIEEPQRPRYIVESMVVRGNSKTRGSLILSQMFLKPGEALDEAKVELSRIRLLALGYFKDVRMVLEKGSVRGRVRLVVEVDERNTIIIDDVFLGISKTNPFWGGLGMSDINFLGRGMVLSGAAVGSEKQQAYRIGLFWPSVMKTNFQAGFQFLFSQARETALKENIRPSSDDACNTFRNTDQELSFVRAGGVLTGGARLDRNHRILIDLHVEYIEGNAYEPVDGAGVKCKNYPFLGYLKDGRSTLSSLTLKFERDTRNDFFLPTHGMLFEVSVELASRVVGSSYEYSKYMIRYEHSFPAFSDHALRLTAVGGLIQDVGTSGSPYFSRFFVGDYSLFWFDKGSLPRNVDLNFSDVADYGDVLASINAEYDIPIWSTGKFFYRAYLFGAVNYSYVTKAAFLSTKEEWSGKSIHPFSADFGVKLDTQIGLFILSLGYLVDTFF